MFRFVILLAISTYLIPIISSASNVKDIPFYEVGKDYTQLKHFSVGLVTDSSMSLTYEKVKQAPYQIINSQFSIPSSNYNFWFILKLKNSSNNPVNRLIGFDEVFMEHADIFYETDSILYTENNGLLILIGERTFRNRCPLFNTTINANDTLTVYLKLNSKFLNTLNIVVEDKASHTIREQKILILHWFYFGAAFSIILYNFFLYFQIREKVYLYYVV